MTPPAKLPQRRKTSPQPDVAVTWRDPSLSSACSKQIGTSLQFGSQSLKQFQGLVGSEKMQMKLSVQKEVPLQKGAIC